MPCKEWLAELEDGRTRVASSSAVGLEAMLSAVW
jgi:hypothetical protein